MGKCDNCPVNYRDFSPMASKLPQKPIQVVKGNAAGAKHHILRFNTPTTIRLDEILSDDVTMKRIVDEREQEEVNLEGGGSEFGWKSKQARLALKYKVKAIKEESCPWELKDRNDKLYTGRKEGGIAANSSYIVIRPSQSQPDVYEAFPIEDWVTFTPKISYTTLNDEEAEDMFAKRHKTQSHQNLMLQKRLKDNLGVETEYDNAQLKVHDAEDLFGDSDDAAEDLIDDPSKKRKKKMKKFTKSKEKDEEELNREKDDEMEDEAASHEVDYISESDSDESIDLTKEKPDTVSKKSAVLEEGQLFHESNSEDEEEDLEMKKLLMENGEEDSGSDLDENSEEFKALMLKNKTAAAAAAVAAKDSKRERSATPVSSSNGKENPSKKQKIDRAMEGTVLNEENVWRYLARKPISTKELIAKFKSKKSGLNKQEMVFKLSSILKKIAKQFLKDGKNYFVLKDEYKNLYKE